jgi:hypothetical protein
MVNNLQELEINGVKFPLRCKNCLEVKYYQIYKCSDCNLSKFEGF